MPRSLHVMDDILESEGFVRIAFTPAVSFVLNGSIDARSRLGLTAMSALWSVLQKVYRSDRATQALSDSIRLADRLLKRHALAYSSSLVAYRKQLLKD
ncbi:MAG TPA: hypothetical protein VN666_18785 [Nitrospira sp.]|nr:hypothetical protein [Nitrospira sp.]